MSKVPYTPQVIAPKPCHSPAWLQDGVKIMEAVCLVLYVHIPCNIHYTQISPPTIYTMFCIYYTELPPVQRLHSRCTHGVAKQRIIRSRLNEENMPAPQMSGYGAFTVNTFRTCNLYEIS